MKLYKYVCDECDMDFWSDVPEADYCCNCGSPKIEEEYYYEASDLVYLDSIVRNTIAEN